MNAMKVYSREEMIALWRKVMNIDVARRECSVERADGIDVDALLQQHIDVWYGNLLQTAPLKWVPVSDVAQLVNVSADAEGVVTLVLPEHCVRLMEVQMQGWRQSVCEFASPDSEVAHMQASQWLRGGNCNPVAVAYDNRVVLYSITHAQEPVVALARGVIRPHDGSYVFSEQAISTIPRLESII